MNSKKSDNPDADVTVFDDLTSNCTFAMASGVAPDPKKPQIAAYFEGTNILVYIRGKSDGPGRWWDAAGSRDSEQKEKVLTLVNAHYDSYVPVPFRAETTEPSTDCIQGLHWIRRNG